VENPSRFDSLSNVERNVCIYIYIGGNFLQKERFVAVRTKLDMKSMQPRHNSFRGQHVDSIGNQEKASSNSKAAGQQHCTQHPSIQRLATLHSSPCSNFQSESQVKFTFDQFRAYVKVTRIEKLWMMR
jgi:hypothetical protein